jgi:hypothetical protein
MSTLRPVLLAVVVVVVLVVGGLTVLGPHPQSPFALGTSQPTPRSTSCDARSEQTGAAPLAAMPTGPPVSLGEAWADDVTLPDEGPGFMYDIASFENRAVAVGRLVDTSSALIALSDDGFTWRIASNDGPDFTRSEAVNAVGTARGFVASGAIITDDHGGSAGAFWWSETGEHWQRLPQPVAYINELGWGPCGLLARGFALDGSLVLGSSADGRDWRWAAWTAIAGPHDVAPTEDGWIAVGSISVGRDDAAPAVWRSTNGADWTRQLLSTTVTEPFGQALSVYPGRATTLVRGEVYAHCSAPRPCAAGSSAVWIAVKDGSWRRVESDDLLFLSALAVGADGSFVAITDAGVLRSDDGMTWHEVSDQVPLEGLPNVIAVMPWGLVGVSQTYQAAPVRPSIVVLPAE